MLCLLKTAYPWPDVINEESHFFFCVEKGSSPVPASSWQSLQNPPGFSCSTGSWESHQHVSHTHYRICINVNCSCTSTFWKVFGKLSELYSLSEQDALARRHQQHDWQVWCQGSPGLHPYLYTSTYPYHYVSSQFSLSLNYAHLNILSVMSICMRVCAQGSWKPQ